MSDHQQFLKERDEIDVLVTQGFRIKEVSENLDGAFVTFSHSQTNEIRNMVVGTANARKYFSTVLIKQGSLD